MRTLAILFTVAACAACGSTGGQQSAGGYATYDALARATEACKAKGGRLVLVRNGDAQMLGDYECRKTEVSAQ